ncbi:outer membrane protein assembly factor BamE [Tabrizicola sp. J26]|uniref:outer membrane protein assembly factor BamE n=1 Tax=Alitabrizicola rongguiensis TaxID=2909234 RepID=UPI001F1CFDE6|nr:outer membrane protein assembly factor BamE [Tabrizicola rongguiensis]MCF1710050.1 outer membrane protein assembly factor BamE [Tabrizicola rongguiensis]
MGSSAIAGNSPHVRFGMRLALFALVCTMVAALSACTPIYRYHGYAPTDLELNSVEVGKDTRETVEEKIGHPSAEGLLNDDAWFFVQSRFERSGIKPMTEVDRQVVVISFAEAGTVSNIERYGLQDGNVVVLSRRVTESNIKGVSFMRQLMNSMGRMSTDSILGGGNAPP